MKKIQKRDSEATKRRLLEAATEEFARYGISGARVDRIADKADANKAQIYNYFGNKDDLFEAVFGQIVEYVVGEVPLYAADLPGYAARLFDGYEEHPDIARLATWYRLEREGSEVLIPAITESNDAKILAIAEAQSNGEISSRFSPEVLLGLVMHLAALWTAQTPEYLSATRGLDAKERREIVIRAVEAFVRDPL